MVCFLLLQCFVEMNSKKNGVRLEQMSKENDWDLYNIGIYGAGLEIGNEANANAYKSNGKCPKFLDIPRKLKQSETEEAKEVLSIGKWAFRTCGYGSSPTVSIFVPNTIQIIKSFGLGWMHNVKNFTLEDGSRLQEIEENGLNCIGYNCGLEEQRTCTLVLPSTLTKVAENGIYCCNVFRTVIYCGSTFLSNPCDLETSNPKTIVKVTDQCKSNTIFGSNYDAEQDSSSETSNKCINMSNIPVPLQTPIVLSCDLCKNEIKPIISIAFALISTSACHYL